MIKAGNLATGKTAFAQNEIGIAPHAIAKVNDGLFGNANSWIAEAEPSYIGVVLGTQPVTVNRLAFGRDNTTAGYTDRTLGLYTLEFTTASDPTTNAAAWTEIGTLDYQSAGGANFANPSRRHEFTFTPVSATGFRIRVSSGAEARCIDELELYTQGYAVSGGGITLVAENGSILPNNLAIGKPAFAKDEIGTPPHAIANVNDGLFGNPNSWIAGSGDSFIGISLGSVPQGLDRVAFGRGNNDIYFDRVFGLYTLQYTTVPSPDANTAEANWSTIGTIQYHYAGGVNFAGPRHRHEFTFDRVQATGFRLKVLAEAAPIAIDELELYSAPGMDLTGAGLTFSQQGGTPRTANLAIGKTAFAQDEIGLAPHAVAKVNDGVYGNDNSWIGGSQNSSVGIDLGVATEIQRIAFGRDNQGVKSDRCLGTYTLQYTSAAAPDDWLTLGTITYRFPAYDLTIPGLRHEFTFPAVVARKVRLLTATAGTTPLDYLGIDELEVYSRLPQTLTFPSLSNKAFGDPPVSLMATGGASGEPVVFSLVSGPASLSGATLTITGAGSVTVRATQLGTADYAAATPVERTFTVEKAVQAITFDRVQSLSDSNLLTLAAVGGNSGIPVTYSLLSGAAVLTGNVLTFSGTGTVVVHASQLGNANYLPASVDQTLSIFSGSLVSAEGGTDTVPTSPRNLAQFGTAFAKDLSPINAHTIAKLNDLSYGNNHGWVGFSQFTFAGINLGATPTAVSMIAIGRDNSGLFTDRSVGSYTIEYTLEPNPSATTTAWTPIGTVDYRLLPDFSVVSAARRHLFAFKPVLATGIRISMAAATPGDVNCMGIDELELYGPQPNQLLISNAALLENNAPGAVVGTLFRINSAGNLSTTETFAFAGGPDDAAFNIVGNNLTINASADYETKTTYQIRLRSTSSGGIDPLIEKDFIIHVIDINLPAQVITFAKPDDRIIGDAPFQLSATGGGSSQPVIFSLVSGPASVVGTTVTLTGSPGQVTLRASQAGAGEYSPAADVVQTFVVRRPQTISFPFPATRAIFDPPFQLLATGGGSGLPIVFTLISGPASLNGDILTYTGMPGLVRIVASQAGNAEYAPATSVDSTFSVKLRQTVVFPPVGPLPRDAAPVILTASSEGNTEVPSRPFVFTVISGPATITGNTLALNGTPGSVVVRATHTGVGTSYGIAFTEQTISVLDLFGQTISFAQPSPVLRDAAPFPLTATGGASSLPVTFFIVSGPARVQGNILTLAGVAGPVVIRASQAGNASYAAAPAVERTLTVRRLPQAITDWTPPARAALTQPTFLAIFGSTGPGSTNPVVFSIVSGPGNISGTFLSATAEGEIIVAASKAGDVSFDDAPILTRTFQAGTSLELWRHQHFNRYDNAAAAADHADPNHNGIPNLLEYALGGNPVDSSTGQTILPKFTLQPNGSATYTFTRTPARDDLLLYIEISSKLTQWQTLAGSGLGQPFTLAPLPGLTVNETGTGATRQVTVSVSNPAQLLGSSNQSGFLRVRASDVLNP